MNANRTKAVAGALMMALSGAAGTVEASDWILRVGGHYVEPKSNNHATVNVASGQSVTFDLTYRYTPRWSVELLAAVPFQHDVELNANGSKVASVKHLPPTLSVQYNFSPTGRVRPYAGLGVNATLFFDEKTTGALAGSELSLRNSFGPAAQLGVDIDVSRSWFVNLDARWIDIDTNARLQGASLGAVHIDPMTVGLSFGRQFGHR